MLTVLVAAAALGVGFALGVVVMALAAANRIDALESRVLDSERRTESLTQLVDPLFDPDLAPADAAAQAIERRLRP